MKTLIKLLCLTVCVLVFATCQEKPEEKPINKPEKPVEPDYTVVASSTTNSYFQVGDSIWNFEFINGSCTARSPLFNMNSFNMQLRDSFTDFCAKFEIFIEEMQPSIFFQKGARKIDTLHIGIRGQYLGCYYEEYHNARSVFTWDIISYENRGFQGKGSLEIMDTLYTKFSKLYYPPQKIEFEFK